LLLIWFSFDSWKNSFIINLFARGGPLNGPEINPLNLIRTTPIGGLACVGMRLKMTKPKFQSDPESLPQKAIFCCFTAEHECGLRGKIL